MSGSGQRVFVALGLVLAGLLACGVGHAAPNKAAVGAEKTQHWSARGGTVGVRWNRELAADLGLVLGAAQGRQAQLSEHEHEVFELRQSGSLEFKVSNGNLRDFTGGSVQASGGYVIGLPGGRIDLTDFQLVPRGEGSTLLDLVSADGRAWFYVDRLMYELIDDQQRLAVRTMDLRITPELAARLGQPAVAGWAIADVELTTNVLRQGVDLAPPSPTATVLKWHGTAVPGVPGAVYQADLFMQALNFQYSRCDSCTGVGGNGRAVFTPSSTLRNNVNNGAMQSTVPGDLIGSSAALWAADIPWYSKFTANSPPYNNDQHPFLIWNLYRINADGSIEQIGRSGVKHAFLTTNTNCPEDPGNSHALGRGCYDLYSTSNNDTNTALGPRSEIIPATNQWGRCGSIYDTNCDGIANSASNTNYDQRLVVRESQFSGAAQTGATYWFESWYLARDDVNIYNSMATTRATFTRSGSTWIVGANDQYQLGPAIDRWVNPAGRGTNQRSILVVSSEGRTKVAVKATDLGNRRWRYDYAVMNLDFARARTEGAEPNLRVLSNAGFNSFSVPADLGTVTDPVFSDGDLNSSNDWTVSIGGGKVTWNAPVGGSTLDWGTLFRFSFIVDRAPAPTTGTLGIANAGSPVKLFAPDLLGPSNSTSKF